MRFGRGLAIFLGMHIGPPAGQQKAVATVQKLVHRHEARIGRDHQRQRARHLCHGLEFIVPPAWAGILIVDQQAVADDADLGRVMLLRDWFVYLYHCI
jgi:hypothetical protein